MSDPILSTGVIPVGTVIAFAGEKNNIPAGWLPCEGQVLSNNNYPQLFKVLGTIWGGTGTPNFYLPDLRGLFLRGVAGDSNTDPDKDDRYSPQLQHSPSNPGNRGNIVGSLQGDAFKGHDHRQLGRQYSAIGPEHGTICSSSRLQNKHFVFKRRRFRNQAAQRLCVLHY